MNAHEKQHVQLFGNEFRKLTEQIKKTMTEPTAENGYALHEQLETAIVFFMYFVNCSSDDEPENEPSTPPTPKSAVN